MVKRLPLANAPVVASRLRGWFLVQTFPRECFPVGKFLERCSKLLPPLHSHLSHNWVFAVSIERAHIETRLPMSAAVLSCVSAMCAQSFQFSGSRSSWQCAFHPVEHVCVRSWFPACEGSFPDLYRGPADHPRHGQVPCMTWHSNDPVVERYPFVEVCFCWAYISGWNFSIEENIFCEFDPENWNDCAHTHNTQVNAVVDTGRWVSIWARSMLTVKQASHNTRAQNGTRLPIKLGPIASLKALARQRLCQKSASETFWLTQRLPWGWATIETKSSY